MARSVLSALSELRETRLEKAQALKELGNGPYALRFESSHRTANLQADHADLAKGEERLLTVSVAGRVMTRRVMGKLAFYTLADETGTIQLYLEKATIDAAASNELASELLFSSPPLLMRAPGLGSPACFVALTVVSFR